MRKFLDVFGVKAPPNHFMDLISETVAKQDAATITHVRGDEYLINGNPITITYLVPEIFEEIQVSFGYEMGKGFKLVLRNYVEHLVVINHEIQGEFATVKFPVPTESYTLNAYRAVLDKFAEDIMTRVRELTPQ